MGRAFIFSKRFERCFVQMHGASDAGDKRGWTEMAPEERGGTAPSSGEGHVTALGRERCFNARGGKRQAGGLEVWGQERGGGFSGGFCYACEVPGQASCCE